jgi:chromosome segregation protein
LAKELAARSAKEVEDEAAAIRAHYEAEADRVRSGEAAVKEWYRAQEGLQKERLETELALNQLNHQWEVLNERLVDKYGRELHAVVEEFRERVGEDYPLAERQTRRDELREKIERMGEVNPTAVEEFEEISERYSFLANQEADLISALENLELTIAKINSTYKREFKKTFDEVNAKFAAVFPRLFKGGKGLLTLNDPDNILDSGVEIMAQPPDKKMNTLALLSGGEKALASAALIISLFQVKPSPFCLLDEVDAALDDVNIVRFNEILLELSQNSQLIIITHNKKTMELSHTLYGVTMEKKGVSGIVSVRWKKHSDPAPAVSHEAAANP